MFKKVLEYAGEYRRMTYASIVVMLAGVAVSVVPFWFVYQLITPLMGYGEMNAAGILWRLAGIGACGILYAVLYVWGLSLSHCSASHAEKYPHLPAEKAGKTALGDNSGEGSGRHQEDVH